MRSLASAAALCLAAAIAHAQPAAAPDALVKSVTLEVVDLIAKDNDLRAGNRARLMALVEEKVVPHFDFTAMTALAVGRNWRKASAEQKAKLTEQFKTLLVRTYAGALTSYSNQKFDFRPLRAKPTDTDVVVQVRVLQPGAQPVAIDYSMEKGAAGWKVYDVTVAGVSMLSSSRTEFANIVRNAGIDGLIHELETKNRGLEAAARQ